MAKKTLKSAAGAAEDQLKAGAKRLHAQLGTVERTAGKLASKAKGRLPAAADVRPDLSAVRRRLQQAAAAVTKGKGLGGSPAKATGAAPKSVATAPPSGPSGPDDSWTLAALRAEARTRGLTGYSRKTKADLLAELRG
jgi:hypothetical protein